MEEEKMDDKMKSFFRVKGLVTEFTNCFKEQGFDFDKEYLVNKNQEDGSITIKIDNTPGIATNFVFALGDYEICDNK